MLTSRNLTLCYQNEIIVSDASVNIEEGKISCLVGPNGCGKSTLIRALAGLMPPYSGCVSLDDIEISSWSRRVLAKRLALLPQNPTAPNGITLQQLVVHGRYPYQGPFTRATKADIDAVDWALIMTNMAHLRHRIFSTLSGGERQRGWIALALAQQSSILLLDEPTTYLDIGHQLDILDLLSQINKEQGITIVMVLHDINHASQYADRILAMKKGKIIANDSPLKVISSELLASVFGVEAELILRQDGERVFPFSMPMRAIKKQ